MDPAVYNSVAFKDLERIAGVLYGKAYTSGASLCFGFAIEGLRSNCEALGNDPLISQPVEALAKAILRYDKAPKRRSAKALKELRIAITTFQVTLAALKIGWRPHVC